MQDSYIKKINNSDSSWSSTIAATTTTSTAYQTTNSLFGNSNDNLTEKIAPSTTTTTSTSILAATTAETAEITITPKLASSNQLIFANESAATKDKQATTTSAKPADTSSVFPEVVQQSTTSQVSSVSVFGSKAKEESSLENDFSAMESIPGLSIDKSSDGKPKQVSSADVQAKAYVSRIVTIDPQTNASELDGFANLSDDVKVAATKALLTDKDLTQEQRDAYGKKLSQATILCKPGAQIKMQKTIMVNGSQTVQEYMASKNGELAPENQVEGAQNIADTKNEKVITAGISSIKNSAVKNQVPIVNVLLSSEVSKDAKSNLYKAVIKDYNGFAPENQVNIHKIMLDSKNQEIIEFATANIYHMDKSNQALAVQITMETGNTRAIDIAASNISKYDKSVQNEIESKIQNSNYESAKVILVEAKSKAEAEQAATKSNNKANDTEANSVNIISSKEKIAEVKDLVANNKNDVALAQKISNFTDVEKIALLQECPTTSVISAIMQSNPSLEVLAKIDGDLLKALGYKNMISQLCFLNAEAQEDVVKEAARSGNLGEVRREFLKPQAKDLFDKYQKEIENKGTTKITD